MTFIVGDSSLSSAVGVHDVDLQCLTVGPQKCNHAAVGRPGWPVVTPPMIAKVCLSSTIGVYDVDLNVAVTVAYEGDLGAVRRPCWVVRPIVGDSSLPTAVGVHNVDSLLPSRALMKAILLPSGDQAGSSHMPLLVSLSAHCRRRS